MKTFIAAAILTAIIFPGKVWADSLVCNILHGGEYRTHIYTEVAEPEKDTDIKFVSSSKVVTFISGGQILFYISENTDCTFIKDKPEGRQVALEAYLRQAGPQ